MTQEQVKAIEEQAKHIVDSDVFCLCPFIDDILRMDTYGTDLPTWDDWENLYGWPEPPEYWVDAIEKGYLEDRGIVATEVEYDGGFTVSYVNEDGEDDYDYVSVEDMAESLGYEQEPQEIMQYFLVSPYLYNKLKERGEPVLDWNIAHVWGRCAYGQALSMDGVIQDIAEERLRRFQEYQQQGKPGGRVPLQ